MTSIKHFLLSSLFALGVSLAPMAAGCGAEAEHEHEHDHGHTGFVCPMHPEVHEEEAGECPICGMPLEEESEEEHEAHSH